jgi:FKBP-type peptidyl-prolyl cis-trans isomerase FklB
MDCRMDMRTWSRNFASLLAVLLATACQPAGDGTSADAQADAAADAPAEAAELALEDEVSQASYGIGYTIAANLDSQFAGSLDKEALMAGLQDSLEGRERRLSEAEIQIAIAALAQRQQEAVAARSADALAAGRAFLEENARREGVSTTTSGLQYEVIAAGDGPKPGVSDTVSTHYHGTLVDGSVFDSSVERGQPASFAVNRVIPGWTEALQLMSVGSKWRLFIPPELAYGDRAAGSIPPNSTLIFEVELLSIDG